jgi:hypothetical protein
MIFILLITTTCLGEQSHSLRKSVYEGYQKWLHHATKPEMESSSGPNLYDEGMTDIIALGIPAVPIILETMHWYANNEHDSQVFHLQYALNQIVKVNFQGYLFRYTRGLSSQYNDAWEKWYRNSDKYTKMEFELNIAAWQGFKHDENPELVKEVMRRITNIGVFVLPYLIKEIQNGKIDLIPIVSILTDGKVPSDATSEQCLTWWENNKERYIKLNQLRFDTFRNWSSKDGKFKTPAKFLSATENEVKLEKLNGDIIIVDLSKLSQEDHDYVKRQLESETKTKKNEQENRLYSWGYGSQ